MVCRRGLLELLTCGSHLPGPMNLRAGSRGPEGQAPGWHCLFPPRSGFAKTGCTAATLSSRTGTT